MPQTFKSSAYNDRFEFVAGWLCLDFANTINYAGANQNERLKGFAELVAWGGLTGALTDTKAAGLLALAEHKPVEARSTLEGARTLRLALHHIFSAVAHGEEPDKVDMATLNGAIGKAAPHLHIAGRAERYQFGWLAGDDDLGQVLHPVAWSAAELLTSEALGHVKRCQGAGCAWLFLDETRNHSRRWCSMAHCGNRAKSNRFYARNKDIRA